jgi:hypothetical protein
MSTLNNDSGQKKQIAAPLPSHPSIIPSIYTITIKENESVKWQWLEFPDGNRVVIDYEIISQKTIR